MLSRQQRRRAGRWQAAWLLYAARAAAAAGGAGQQFASFKKGYEHIMQPIEKILDDNRDCGWGFLPDLPTLAKTSSPFEKKIQIKEDKCGNRAMLMGGFVQCHSADERIYHEMLIHPAMMTFTALNGRPPRRVFLGGSGEGSGTREILKWNSVENVTMVDIDYEVTKFTMKHMPQLSGGSFDSPRLHLITGDAAQYLRDLSSDVEPYDVMILDFPDAFEAEELEALYSEEFYRVCRSRMHKGSILSTQSGPCAGVTASGNKIKCEFVEQMIVENMAATFPQVDVLQHPMATWKADEDIPSEWSSLTLASLAADDSEAADDYAEEDDYDADSGLHSKLGQKLFEKKDSMSRWMKGADAALPSQLLSFYSPAVHEAAWLKPAWYLERLEELVEFGRTPDRSTKDRPKRRRRRQQKTTKPEKEEKEPKRKKKVAEQSGRSSRLAEL
eukprot:TRINITY_DN8667_c0_g1_i1.p1 TRINITY_DN8667_c0_g1~~TRINITY_DN8667_c0_g1_i1.p1  ORF type:complete len:443 (+),score=118.11 TRINITY_DN8667_c0_g1_i1:94-1422(+)